MFVNYSISAGDAHAKEAVVVKEQIEALLAEHGLTGTTNGTATESGASFSGNYSKSA